MNKTISPRIPETVFFSDESVELHKFAYMIYGVAYHVAFTVPKLLLVGNVAIWHRMVEAKLAYAGR